MYMTYSFVTTFQRREGGTPEKGTIYHQDVLILIFLIVITAVFFLNNNNNNISFICMTIIM